MDRVISLLAALVGLIALGGAILVHVNGDAQRNQLAAEIAGLKAAISLTPTPAGPSATAPASVSEPASASAISEQAVAVASTPRAATPADMAPSSEASTEPDTAAQLKALFDTEGKTITEKTAGETMNKCVQGLESKVELLQSLAPAKPAAGQQQKPQSPQGR